MLAVPRLCELYPGIYLTTEEKARKNLSQGSRTIRIRFIASSLSLYVGYVVLYPKNCITITFNFGKIYFGARGGVMVKALGYKPAGRGFDSRWCHWNF